MGLSAYLDEPLSQFIARQKRASASTPAAEADQRGDVVEAERCADAAAHRAEAAERRAIAAERRADEAERRATASAPARSIVAPAKPAQQIAAPAPAPAARLTSKEIPVMSTRKQALFREVATTTARLAAARQSLEDARLLAHTCMAGDGPVVLALHVEASAFQAWLRASEAFHACRG